MIEVCGMSVRYPGAKHDVLHDISFRVKPGEIIHQYAKKGSGIMVSGRLDQRSWEDQSTGQKRSRVEIVVEDFNFIGGGQQGNGGVGILSGARLG